MLCICQSHTLHKKPHDTMALVVFQGAIVVWRKSVDGSQFFFNDVMSLNILMKMSYEIGRYVFKIFMLIGCIFF